MPYHDLRDFMAQLELRLSWPALGRFNYTGGWVLTPEFVAITFGLTLYSAVFVAEIVRAGIEAVPKGQWEAARALGLTDRDVRKLVIMPQALRVMVPPMINQYVNILKNSTLALVVGYPDIAFVTATTINQTGQAIEGIAILMLVFFTLSLTASIILNLYNKHLMRGGR